MSPEVKRFIAICQRHRFVVLVGIVLSCVGVIPDILTPIIIASLTGALITFPATHDTVLVEILSGSIVLNMLVNSMIKYAAMRNDNVVTHSLSAQYVKDLCNHIIRLPAVWFTAQKQGAIMSDVSRTIYASQNLSQTMIGEHFGQVVVIIGSLGYALHRYGYIAVPMVPLIVVAAWVSYLWDMKFVATATKARSVATRHMDGDLSDPIQCHAIIRDYDTEVLEGRRIDAVVETWRRACIRAMRGWAIGASGSSFSNSILFGGAVFGSVSLFLMEKLTVADVVYVNSLSLILKGYVNTIGDSLRITHSSLEDLKRVEAIMQESTTKRYPEVLHNPEDIDTIQFRDVVFAYPKSSRPVLNGANFTVKMGQSVGIVGESGSGKTTLMRLLQRDYEPTAGSIGVGYNARHGILHSGMIAHVHQDSMLFHRSIMENIAYPQCLTSTGGYMPFAESAAKAAGAERFIWDMEKHYDTIVGDRGVKLSGGQRQRISIARAIFNKKPILILDEATANLDSLSEDIVKTSLENRPPEQTVFVIAHRLKTARDLDVIVVMKAGSVLGIGTHDELIMSTPYYRELCEKQNAV
mgnify:CR=1 FL=1